MLRGIYRKGFCIAVRARCKALLLDMRVTQNTKSNYGFFETREAGVKNE